jgi:hypothetical protein
MRCTDHCLYNCRELDSEHDSELIIHALPSAPTVQSGGVMTSEIVSGTNEVRQDEDRVS